MYKFIIPAVMAITIFAVSDANATQPKPSGNSSSEAHSSATGVGVGVGVGIGVGGRGGNSNVRQSTSQLNKMSLRNATAVQTGDTNVTVDQRTEDNNDYWWAYASPGIGAGNNAVPATGNYEGTRNIGISGPFLGINIPLTMHDEAAMYQSFGEAVVAAWSPKAPNNIETRLRRSLLCNSVAIVKVSVEDAGLSCPTSSNANTADYPDYPE